MKRVSSNVSSTNKKPKISNHWANGLLSAMEDPALKVEEDDKICVIKDKYPKAEFHYLVLPKDNISSLKSVKVEHLSLLKHIHEIGKQVAKKHDGKNFILGYHSEASMARLHLHVISDDMNSICLKTKKHWNSFTTNFFLKSKDVCKSLEENGKISLPTSEECKNLMNSPLKCNKCDYVPKNMPDLKKHILIHLR